MKSGRAIISPLAAFEVYIPSRHLRSLRDARREKGYETAAVPAGGREETRFASLSPSSAFPAFLASSSFPSTLLKHRKKRPKGREREEGEKKRRGSGWKGMQGDGRGPEGKVRAGSRSREVSEPALRGRNASKGPRIMTSRTAHVAIR